MQSIMWVDVVANMRASSHLDQHKFIVTPRKIYSDPRTPFPSNSTLLSLDRLL